MVPEAAVEFGLSSASIGSIRSVLSWSPRVVRALVYGSRAMGTYRNGSDIDLALFGGALTQDDLLVIDTAVEALDLPYNVDLAIFDAIEDPALRSHIERVGKQLYPGGPDSAAQ